MSEANIQSNIQNDTQLWIAGTPIGNLSDISSRLRLVLESVDILACEDKRRAGRLCQLAGIKRPPKLMLVNEHTEKDAIPKLLEDLRSGSTAALISDAGMPTLSDPGKHLVAAAHAAQIKISVVPGPTSISAALALSGMDANRYVFEGFLPRRGEKRQARMAYLAQEERSVVLFESPHRLATCIADLAKALDPDREIFIGKELTKLHETLWKGPLGKAVAIVDEPTYKKGEYVIVLAGKTGTKKQPKQNP